MHRSAFIWLTLNAVLWRGNEFRFPLTSLQIGFRVNTDTSLDCPLANGKPDDRVRKMSEKCQ
jgi:hypothetical protein